IKTGAVVGEKKLNSIECFEKFFTCDFRSDQLRGSLAAFINSDDRDVLLPRRFDVQECASHGITIIAFSGETAKVTRRQACVGGSPSACGQMSVSVVTSSLGTRNDTRRLKRVGRPSFPRARRENSFHLGTVGKR